MSKDLVVYQFICGPDKKEGKNEGSEGGREKKINRRL